MISFRYHLVSIVAVFLAIGVGVLMGTTVVDRAIVTRLESQLDSLDREVKQERKDRRAAEQEVGVWDEFAAQGVPFFVGGRLAGKTVIVVSPKGQDTSVPEGVATIMRQAGASVPGILWLTDKFELRRQTAREQLKLALGAPDTETATLWSYSAIGLAVRLGRIQPTGDAAAKVNADAQVNLLGRLESDGFVEFQRIDDQQGDVNAAGGAEPYVVVVGNDESKVPDEELVVPLTTNIAPSKRALAAQARSADPFYIRAIRGDAAAVATMSTVDDVQGSIGRFTAVVALSQAPAGIFGAYGTGPGAERLLPERVAG